MPAAVLRMPFHAQLQFRIVLQPPALRVQHDEPLCFHGMRFTKPVCVVISRMRHGVLLGSDTDSLALTRHVPLRFRLRPTGGTLAGIAQLSPTAPVSGNTPARRNGNTMADPKDPDKKPPVTP